MKRRAAGSTEHALKNAAIVPYSSVSNVARARFL
jgi:hypothetical protein